MLATIVAVVIVGARWRMRRHAESLPSYQRARASVEQIIFLRGRVLLRNELSDLFASDDDGRSWRVLSEKPPTLNVANGGDIWGAHGWPGHHEGPSASIWYSSDRGETWSKTELELLDETAEGFHARLPAAFLNEPADTPLLAMSDFQLVRPELAADSSAWTRIGRRIEGQDRPGQSHGPPLLIERIRAPRARRDETPNSRSFVNDSYDRLCARFVVYRGLFVFRTGFFRPG